MEQPMQAEPTWVKPLLQLIWQVVPCRTRGFMQLLQTVAEVQLWQPVAHGAQFLLESMKLLAPQIHLLSAVLV